MSANAKTTGRRAVTPPKGRPTPKRHQRRTEIKLENARSRRLQWSALAILAVALVVALVVFGGGGGGTPIQGAPGGHGG